MNDFSGEYDFMQRIHKIEGHNNNDYGINKDNLKGGDIIKGKDDVLLEKEKYEKDFYLKSKYDKYNNTLNGFEKDDKFSYLKRLKKENELKKRESSSKKSNINELVKINEIVYYIHANKKNVYEYITNQTDLENNYYQIEERPNNLSRNIIKNNEEYIYLNDNAYYKLKINRDEKDGREEKEDEHGIESMNLKYSLDGNKSTIIENIIESDNILIHILHVLLSFKNCVKGIFLFLSKIFHFNFLDYNNIKNYSLTNYFDQNVKEYMKYLKKHEDSRIINHDFLLRRKYITPHFIYNSVDCNYNTNDNGIVILSSILPFIHSFDYDYKLKETRNREQDLEYVLNGEKKKYFGKTGIFEYLKKIKNMFINKLNRSIGNDNNNNNENGDGMGNDEGAWGNDNNEYSEFLKKYENCINEKGELIQDILFAGKAQMIFINFKQLENNFNNIIGNIEIKNEKIHVSNLILGYEKREHIKYTDILISNILKNIKKKYPDIAINDENPKQFIYDDNEFSDKLMGENNNTYGGNHINNMNSNDESNISLTEHIDNNIYKRELYKLSDLKEYVYSAPSHLMRDQKNNCEYVTCVSFDNNSNNCNLINNFVLGYNTGKIEYIYGKIVYNNISHCDLLIDYYSNKNKKFSYELCKRIYLNGSVIKIGFAPNVFFCLILTSKTLYICNFFYFSIYEIPNVCYNSRFVNFLWINNNSYCIFNDNGYIYLYEKNSKSDGLNSFSLVKCFFIDQNIYYNSICEYHLYSHSIYLYTGEIEKRRQKKNVTHFFKKKKIRMHKRYSDYFYKYDCNFIIIDLNSYMGNNCENNKSSDMLVRGLLKDNVTDVEGNMKQIKILEMLIENGANLEEEDANFENMLNINIKDFNNYISTIKDANTKLYMNDSGDERKDMIDYNKENDKFSIKNIFVNYIQDVKRHLYNLKNENIVNVLLPRYYSSGDDYSHKNFLNVRFFTIEKLDNKHLIALDTETDYVYIYKIRKNVHLDYNSIEALKNNPYQTNRNPLHMLYSTYMKKEPILKDEWKIYNEYIYVNTKKLKKYIKYNLLYIIKNHKKIFFPLHVYVINTKYNENEYLLFIKWATIKNSFVYSSYSSLNKVSKMNDYFNNEDEKILKVLENPKNIFLYNINDENRNVGGRMGYPYMPNNDILRSLSGKNKYYDNDYMSDNGNNYISYNRSGNKPNEYRENFSNKMKNFTNRISHEDFMSKTPIKNPERNFFTSGVGNNMGINETNPILYKRRGRFTENDIYNEYYMNQNNKDGNYSNYLNENKKLNESDKKWSYLKKINIFSKKDEDLINDNYGNHRSNYNNMDPKNLQYKNSHMYNLKNDNIFNEMKNSNLYSSPNDIKFNRLHDNQDGPKIPNGDNNMNEYYYMNNTNKYKTSNINNNYDSYVLKNDLYNFRNNININENNNNANNNYSYGNTDFYRAPNDTYYRGNQEFNANVYNAGYGSDSNHIHHESPYRSRFRNYS
ncbi:conserved Plasmodium protein, unknown function [Plasmodium berghei]|uniref:Uncharacterized protein n=2 Tax=Plasmodium berghei TaxID=5821 RepID=A0A509AYN3_PLABA|nr:conserved Plasmodium protein, unknown function [Plasmodium berghei ANKA]SCL98884.1 conserved Plasmodium protein, unknown function [Plasmodium berghei]SCM16924.1 conserved Plasmodium protein, unknown function [Plasmodium berghei]SCN28158.1 conserved Plasmodium protein, unknown function [Plasmodium berghei]VUC58038.1 conserved Plasmodium protein, unknown function [Plasmodium berghei ANKA]|eukprot:XP_034423807.1 conserved Plasmodium protein, unknown function [Plasmodium berghei ANKA]